MPSKQGGLGAHITVGNLESDPRKSPVTSSQPGVTIEDAHLLLPDSELKSLQPSANNTGVNFHA